MATSFSVHVDIVVRPTEAWAIDYETGEVLFTLPLSDPRIQPKPYLSDFYMNYDDVVREQQLHPVS